MTDVSSVSTTALRELPAGLHLAYGGHGTPDQGLCLLEAVALAAGEEHSDHPRCASVVLAAFGRVINDAWSDEERQLLVPLIPRLVGSRGDAALELRRAYVLTDGAVREIAPAGLDAVGWRDLAALLRALAPITDRDTASAAARVAEGVRSTAWSRYHAADADAAADAAAEAAAEAAAARADAAAARAAAAARRPIIGATISAFERAILTA